MLVRLPPKITQALRSALGCAALAMQLAACEVSGPNLDAESTPMPHDASLGSHEDPAHGESEAGAPAGAGPSPTMDAEVRADAAASPRADAASPSAAGAPPPADAGPDAAATTPEERSRDFTVGTRRIDVATDGGRVLPLQLWYPAHDSAAAEAKAGRGIAEFEAPGPRHALVERLIADARKDCPNLIMHAALDAEPYARAAPFPLLVYSHHFNGSRFSMFSIMEGLARAGMVVAAPDHVNGSLFERQDVLTDSLTQFNDEFLHTRVADLARVLDVLLDPSSPAVPQGLRGRMDPVRVGAVGHSLGGITVGVFSARDPRVRASAYLAIVPSPELATLLFDLPKVEQFRTPALYLSASDDSTVESLGGRAELAANYSDQPPPAHWVDVRDTGHFSFADDCGLVPEFDEGCGTGSRVADDQTFTYLAAERAREIAVHYTTLFFAAELADGPRAELSQPHPPELVTVMQRGAKAPSP